MTAAGTANRAGRCSALASAAVNSALVAGVGPTRFTGPSTEPFSSRNPIALDLVVERDPWHVLRARPDVAAQREPEDQLERAEQPTGRGQHQAGAGMHDPPPASRAGWAAASQSRMTSARNPRPRVRTRRARPRRRCLVPLADWLTSVRTVLGDGAGDTSVGTLRLSRIACRAPRSTAGPRPRRRLRFTTRRRRRAAALTRPAGGSQPRSSGAAGSRGRGAAPLPPGPQMGDEGGSDQAGRTGHDDAHAVDPFGSCARARVDARPTAQVASNAPSSRSRIAVDQAAGVRALSTSRRS